MFCIFCSLGDIMVNVTSNSTSLNMDKRLKEAGFDPDGKILNSSLLPFNIIITMITFQVTYEAEIRLEKLDLNFDMIYISSRQWS